MMLIGKTVEITNSKNKSNIGIRGKVIDETKKTLVIKSREGKKRLLKKSIELTIKK